MKLAPVLAYPAAQEAIYHSSLLRYLKSCKKLIKEQLLSKLNDLLEARESYIRKDDFLDDFERIIKDLSNRFNLNEQSIFGLFGQSLNIPDIEAIAANTTLFTLRQLARYLPLPKVILSQSSNFRINIFENDPELTAIAKSFALTNSRLIKTISQDLLDDVAFVVQTAFQKGTLAEDLKDEIAKRFEVSDKRARVIARDQISKLSANIRRSQNQRFGLNDYVWQATAADNTRPSHAALSGKICNYDDITTYKNTENGKLLKRSSINGVEANPGQPPNCRCQDRAIIIY